MISVGVAVQNRMCRNCTATMNLKKMSDHDRRTWFACGLCPDCSTPAPQHAVQLTLFGPSAE